MAIYPQVIRYAYPQPESRVASLTARPRARGKAYSSCGNRAYFQPAHGSMGSSRPIRLTDGSTLWGGLLLFLWVALINLRQAP